MSWLAGRISRKPCKKRKASKIRVPQESSNIFVLAGLPLSDSVASMPKLTREFCTKLL